MKDIKSIEFGKARAELEGVSTPELLEKGYLDHQSIIDKIRHGYRFLVLGYKGSGKSAVAEKIRLESFPETNVFAETVFLSDFPFKSFDKIFSGSSEKESKLPTSWSWLLLLMLMSSYKKDLGAETSNDISFLRSYDTLSEFGLLPSGNIRQIVLQSSKKTFKIQLPKILEYATETCSSQAESDLQFSCLVDHLKDICCNFKSDNLHIVIIDGLDDILTMRKIQYKSLSALLFEVDRLNLLFFRSKTPAKFVLLCRTDLFEKLPGPNKNKIRQDNAIELDWYHDPRSPHDSLLVKLVNLRAKLSLEREIDIFQKYFRIKKSGQYTVQFLLEHTRHTPRDFIQLLNHLKPYYKGGLYTYGQIMSGIRDYSLNYFLPEIRDEAVGYIDEKEFDRFIKILGLYKKREFSYPNLKSFSKEHSFDSKTTEKALIILYGCSAIINTWDTPQGKRYESKYRNRHSTLDINQSIIIHKGLWKALNI
jgi:hypothetical protein